MHETGEAALKIYMKEQQVNNRQANFNEEQHWGLVLSNIKEGDKIIETEKVWYWCRNRAVGQNSELRNTHSYIWKPDMIQGAVVLR